MTNKKQYKCPVVNCTRKDKHDICGCEEVKVKTGDDLLKNYPQLANKPKPLKWIPCSKCPYTNSLKECDEQKAYCAFTIRSALEWAEKKIDNEFKTLNDIATFKRAKEIYRKAFAAVLEDCPHNFRGGDRCSLCGIDQRTFKKEVEKK